jgi:hypothetical protein
MLQHMYQAWCDGNELYIKNWSEFVYKTSMHFHITTDETMKELQKYSWFYWKYED